MQPSGQASATSLPIGSDADLAWVRQQVRQCAAQLGFGLVQQTVGHGGQRAGPQHAGARRRRASGDHTAGQRPQPGPAHVFHRQRPGIRDLELAMTDGYTTGGGLGLGLSGAKRLVHEFSVDTEPGRGTTVTGRRLGGPGARVTPGGGMSRVWEVPVHDSTRVRDARIAAREACGDAGLDAARARRWRSWSATELATNLLKHAGGGRMVVNLVAPPRRTGRARRCRLFSLDHGPGIADVGAALGTAGPPPRARSARAWAAVCAAPTPSICTACRAVGRWRRPGSTRRPTGGDLGPARARGRDHGLPQAGRAVR